MRRTQQLHNSDVWEYDGANWTQGTPDLPGPVRNTHGFVYHPGLDQVVLFGGTDASGTYLSDLWFYRARNQATLRVVGQGCPSSVGLASLARLSMLPTLGATFDLALQGVPSPSLAVGFLGTSTTTWGATPLPFDLGGIGMPGCRVLTDPAHTATFRGERWSIALPPDPFLANAQFFLQCLVVDPAAPGGAAITNAIEARLGTR